MRWVVVEDEHGRTPAVRVSLPTGDVELFVLQSVARRWARGEKPDPVQIFDSAAEDVLRLSRG